VHILLWHLGNSAMKWGSLLILCAIAIVLSRLVYDPRIVHSARRSNITSYQRKRTDSFQATYIFELLQLSSRAPVHSHHSSMKPQETLNNFQHIIRSAPDALKKKRHCSVCFSGAFKSYRWTGHGSLNHPVIP